MSTQENNDTILENLLKTNINEKDSIKEEILEIEEDEYSNDDDSNNCDELSLILKTASKENYIKAFNAFESWKNKLNINDSSEETLIKYFTEISKFKSASTLWCIYSMLKSTIFLKEKVNIKGYESLIKVLHKFSKGYVSKSSKNFTDEEISRFLNEAPDDIYLLHKIILIIGKEGGLRKTELYKLTLDNLIDRGDVLIITVPNENTKNITSKKFVLTGSYYQIYKKYILIRPKYTKTNHFFLAFRQGKCLNATAGTNKIGDVPKEIARYLGLKDPELYTSNALKFSSISKNRRKIQDTCICRELENKTEPLFIDVKKLRESPEKTRLVEQIQMTQATSNSPNFKDSNNFVNKNITLLLSNDLKNNINLSFQNCNVVFKIDNKEISL